MKRLFNWFNSRMKYLDIMDVAMIKWCVFVFALAMAKVWPPLLQLDLPIYIGFGVLMVARPAYHFYFKKSL